MNIMAILYVTKIFQKLQHSKTYSSRKKVLALARFFFIFALRVSTQTHCPEQVQM